MIIDDEIAQDSAFVRLLALEQVEATCAFSGRSGLALVQCGAFDAILLDLKLPDVLGITVLSELRRLKISVPVLVVTGYFLETDHHERARQLGAAAFLHKPLFDVEDLAAIIRRSIAVHMSQPAAPQAQPSHAESASTLRPSPRTSIGREGDHFPQLMALHQRALQGDVAACDAIVARLLPELRRRLKSKYPNTPSDWIENSIVDALLEYRVRPGRYDPNRGLSLIAYLAYAAKRNLKNCRISAYRRLSHETTDAAPALWDAVKAPQAENDLWAAERVWLWRSLRTVTAHFTHEERTVFRLQLAGEHRTSEYARALHFTDLALDEQIRRVRRLTNRVWKVALRRLRRLRDAEWGRFSG